MSNAVVAYGSRALTDAGRIGKHGKAIIEVVTSVYNNVVRWWNDEISGERCAKNIIDDMATEGGKLIRAACGATLGAIVARAIAGPIGMAIGGAIGGYVGAFLSKKLVGMVGMLTEEIFDLPKSEALEKAYNFMDLHHKCSNEEVNQRYKKLALVYHPDKQGGSDENFVKLYACVAIIRAARENE